jgi:hypothetical protein
MLTVQGAMRRADRDTYLRYTGTYCATLAAGAVLL